MQWLHQLRSGLRLIFRRDAADRQVDEELQSYMAERAADLEATGVPGERARRRARTEFGSIESVKEGMRDAVPVARTIDAITRDVQYAGRMMRRSPGFSAAVVVTLALAIGGISAVFSVFKVVLLDPLPYAEPHRLVLVWNTFGTMGLTRAPGAGFALHQLRARSRSFEGIGGIWVSNGTFLGEDEPEQVKVGNVTGDFLPLLGAEPLLGRTLLPGDEGPGRPEVIVLSHGLWQRRFGGDASVLGQPVRMEGANPIVVGVMRPEFRMAFPPDANVPRDTQAWVPFPYPIDAAPRNQYFLRYVARLKPGVTLAQAREDAATVGADLRREFTEYDSDAIGFNLVPMHNDSVREIRPALLAVFGGVALVLTIACVNVANLMLARAGARRKEIALRAAIGASRGRIMRQMLIESMTLALAGGAAGLLVGWWSLQQLSALAPPGLFEPGSLRMDPVILAFTAIVTLGCGLLFGMAPATEALRVRLADALQGIGRGTSSALRSRSRAALIVFEFAVGFVLLVGAGLMIRTFVETTRIDPGFRAEGLLSFEMDLPGRRYPSDQKRTQLVQNVEEALRALPGVSSVGGVSHLPLDDYPNWYGPVAPEGASETDTVLMADHRAVTPGYLPSVGARLVAGRYFNALDESSGRGVVVIDERLALEAFPGQDPVGRKLMHERVVERGFESGASEVVGVIRHVQHHALTRQVRAQVYIPFGQSVRWHISMVVRTAGDPAALTSVVRGALAGVDKNLAISKARPMTFYLDRALAATRFTMVLATLFGALALILAAVGTYGVVAYSVTQRTREFGVRLALGARPLDIVRQVMSEGMRLACLGMVIGVAGAFALGRVLTSLLFGVAPTDLPTFALAALVMPLAALAACWLPARRAAGHDPLVALRVE